MDSETTNLTYKRIFLFWLPLESTWLMMAMEGALMRAIIARMAAPKFNLSAFGVAFSFLLILEAPIMMIIIATPAQRSILVGARSPLPPPGLSDWNC